MVIILEVFIRYPTTEEGNKILLNNLVDFKVKLLLKSIENLDYNDKVKEEVLKKILEILNSMPKDDTI